MRQPFPVLVLLAALFGLGLPAAAPAFAQVPLQLGDEPLPEIPPQNRSGEPVDLELVLLADATGSIDDKEIFFQRQGYADALQHPDILSAISLGHDGKIAVTYVEWGDATSQEIVVPWTIIDGQGAAANFAEALMETPRRAFGRNAIGSAITFAHLLIESNSINGYRRVIDFSGDSANSWGGVPVEAARQAVEHLHGGPAAGDARSDDDRVEFGVAVRGHRKTPARTRHGRPSTVIRTAGSRRGSPGNAARSWRRPPMRST